MHHKGFHGGRHFERFARKMRGMEEGLGRGRHMGGGRHGGLGRFFAHGDLRLVILNMIAEKPRHGYELIKEIEDSVSGAYTPSPGVIYPTLTLLEELGYVEAAAEGAKKLYTITDEGRAFLTANQATVDNLRERMAEAGDTHGRGRAAAIVRAMENLKVALRLRAASGGINNETIDAIAAIIDDAATKVEKL
ncbi:MAG: PadR family transcriptional regulator [Hyphomonadaceae bacterium]